MAIDDKVTWHDGTLKAKDIIISNAMTIGGSITFGDASTDTLTVNGLSTFNANMDVNANIDVDATSASGNMVDIANAGTGATMKVSDSATNSASTIMEIEGTSTAAGATGAGLLIDLNSTGNIGIGLEIDDESTGNSSTCVQIASKRTDTVLYVISEGVGAPLVVLQNATNTANGKGIFVNQDSTHASCSYNLHVDDESTGTTQCIYVESARTGTLVEIAAAAGLGQEIDIADGNTGTALQIDHNETDGNAVGLHIDVASTGANAFAVKITGIATNAGVFQTNVSTDCAIDNCTGVIRIQAGSTTYYIPCLSTFT